MSPVEQSDKAARPARQRLLRAAEELFYAYGIASVGVDAVVSRAGVATASLYNNFGGKDDLIVGYLQARDGRWRQHWEAHIEQHSDTGARVLAVFTALDTWNSGHLDPDPGLEASPDPGLGLNNGCANLAALQQLSADHPAAAVARDHKAYLLDRLRQLATDAGCPEPAVTAIDLLLVYEGTLSLQATGHGANAVRHGRRLARLLLADVLHSS